MVVLVPDRAKRLWEEWNIRSFVLLSLSFQVALIFTANSRKRTGSRMVTAFIWSLYLLSDWIAAFTVGLISSGQANDCPGKLAVSKHVAAFWAPFLLLHLGGPDVITAFSLEDNELWIRHLLGLGIQVFAVVYVFLQSLPNQFWIPTVLMFLVGTCKYIERTRALYKACLVNFKNSLLPKPESGPNYAQLMEEYSAINASGVPVRIDIVKEPPKAAAGSSSASDNINQQLGITTLEEIDIVLNGYRFFNIFKGLIVDHMFSFHERSESRDFFFRRTAIDAFKVMEVELNFMYDALYTKMSVVHCKIGYFFRFLCISLLVALCFQQFTSDPRHKIFHVDIIVTYILLGGAVFLDLVGIFNLVLSDWTIVSAKRKVSRLLIGKRWRWRQRWSNTISQHSFISFVAGEERFTRLKIIAGYLGIKDAVDEFDYKKTTTCEDNLKEFIFDELKAKAVEAQTTKVAKEIISSRGDRVLGNYPNHYPYPSISSSVSPEEAEYDESLLLWHIATELCYFKTMSQCQSPPADDHDRYKKFCKVISDYMLYLLVMRPALMSAVAGIAQIRFQDTCEEAKKFFRRWESELDVTDDQRHKLVCEKLLEVKTVVNVKPNEVKGDRSKSLLFDACILANDLMKLGDVRWQMMSKVWVELLSYAASHCRPNAHAQQLSKGGELITFVWLQMAHFGLGEQFRIEAGHARAKLLVSK